MYCDMLAWLPEPAAKPVMRKSRSVHGLLHVDDDPLDLHEVAMLTALNARLQRNRSEKPSNKNQRDEVGQMFREFGTIQEKAQHVQRRVRKVRPSDHNNAQRPLHSSQDWPYSQLRSAVVTHSCRRIFARQIAHQILKAQSRKHILGTRRLASPSGPLTVQTRGHILWPSRPTRRSATYRHCRRALGASATLRRPTSRLI